MDILLTPSDELIDQFINEFNSDERYYSADQTITRLISKFPNNIELDDILIKVIVINNLYSTNIFSTYNMAIHIKSLQIDKDLQANDPLLVNRIASGHGIMNSKTNEERIFYSFATKYCSWHNRDNYPIFDNFVEKMLIAYRNQDNFSIFKNEDLRSYPKLKIIYADFKHFYKLKAHDLKQIDKFLWLYGKKQFPKNY